MRVMNDDNRTNVSRHDRRGAASRAREARELRACRDTLVVAPTARIASLAYIDRTSTSSIVLDKRLDRPAPAASSTRRTPSSCRECTSLDFPGTRTESPCSK